MVLTVTGRASAGWWLVCVFASKHTTFTAKKEMHLIRGVSDDLEDEWLTRSDIGRACIFQVLYYGVDLNVSVQQSQVIVFTPSRL